MKNVSDEDFSSEWVSGYYLYLQFGRYSFLINFVQTYLNIRNCPYHNKCVYFIAGCFTQELCMVLLVQKSMTFLMHSCNQYEGLGLFCGTKHGLTGFCNRALSQNIHSTDSTHSMQFHCSWQNVLMTDAMPSTGSWNTFDKKPKCCYSRCPHDKLWISFHQV